VSISFYARQFFCIKKLQSQNVTREKLCKELLYKKRVIKMLVKLATGGKNRGHVGRGVFSRSNRFPGLESYSFSSSFDGFGMGKNNK